MKEPLALLLVAASCILISCAPLDRVVYDQSKRQPTTAIDIYKDGSMPGRKFRVIAELSMPGHRDNELLRQKQIMEEAKRMGGNGLIFVVEPSGTGAFGASEWYFRGKVIVYE
jgi:hypothetical protein